MYKSFFVIFFLIIYSWAENEDIFFEEELEKVSSQAGSILKFAFQYEEDYSDRVHLEVQFFLSTREDNSELPLFVNDHETLRKSTFNKNRPTILIIHGYTDHRKRKIIVKLRDSILNNFDYNVIVVDWKRLAGQLYFTTVSYVTSIGKFVGSFLQFLVDAHVNLADVHLIGHSLGAQISGIAADTVNSIIGRITGLDPAGPLFDYIEYRNKSESLHSGQAQFVDVIHTAVNNYGVTSPVGHVDFYPNDGAVPQPGCDNIILAVTCSHVRSIQLYIESINTTNPFLSKKCKYVDDGVPMDCSNVDLVPMGYHTPKSARGIFYLQTRSDEPYSLGPKFYKRSPRNLNE